MAMAGLKPHHRIALGVSGGPDSMALCRLTAHWKASSSSVSDSNGFIDGLMAIIVDHGLRTESREEAETVSSRVSKLGISCEIATGDWSNGRPKQGHLQEAAKDLRFRVFQEVCVKKQIGVLLIAHHADDQKMNQGIKFQLRMAKALSSIFFKGVTCLPGGPLSTTQVAGHLFQSRRQFSTKLPEDSDTHEDFRPTSKLENSGLSTKDIVEQDVKENPIMIYMKGVPDLPRCGFSSLAVRVLKEYNVPISARNILEDAELKNAVKAVSNWPTFPQVFIKGEFVGGSDIVLNMHQNGELKEMLKDVTVGQEKSE